MGENGVTSQMAINIVYQLEMINVDNDQRPGVIPLRELLIQIRQY